MKTLRQLALGAVLVAGTCGLSLVAVAQQETNPDYFPAAGEATNPPVKTVARQQQSQVQQANRRRAVKHAQRRHAAAANHKQMAKASNMLAGH